MIKKIKKYICKMIIVFILLSFVMPYLNNSYALDYSGPEFELPPSNTGGHSPSNPSPDAPNNNNIDTQLYVQTNTLTGNIYEKIEAIEKQDLGGENKDSSDNAYGKGIEKIPVSLYLNGSCIGNTLTGSDGTYNFDISGVSAGEHTFTIKYTYPGVTEEDINNISQISEAQDIQKKLKYNAQDYVASDSDKAVTIKTKGGAAAQVFLLMDFSASMDESITVNGVTKTKLELEKEFAKKLVNKLLKQDSNIYIGLIIFRGDSRKMVSLTNNLDTLNQAIDSAESSFINNQYYTNIIDALDKATHEKKGFASPENRFIFLLSDGIPTYDGKVENKLYKTDTNGSIKNENDTKLARIVENTKNRIEKMENEQITIYSIIANDRTDSEINDKLDYIYLQNKDDRYNKYYEINDISDLIIDNNIINNFSEYVKSSIEVNNIEYNIQDQERGINQQFKDEYDVFKFKNTQYFEALDMKIENFGDIKTFKEYAKQILENTKVTMEKKDVQATVKHETLPSTTQIYRTITNSSGETQRILAREIKNTSNANERLEINYLTNHRKLHKLEYRSIQAGDVYLEKIQAYTLEPIITASRMYVTAQNGATLLNVETSPYTQDGRNTNIYATIDEEKIYGSSVTIEYNIGVVNKSAICGVDNLRMLFYMPEGFQYVKGLGKSSVGVYLGNELIQLDEPNITEINSSNVNSINGLYVSNNLANYINNGNTVLAITINKSNGFDLLTNGQAYAKFSVSKLLEPGAEMCYEANAEIMTYSNPLYRRMQYKYLANSILDGAVAADMNEDEKDYTLSNQANLLLPTGKNKSMIYIQILLTSLIIAGYSIILYKIKMNI